MRENRDPSFRFVTEESRAPKPTPEDLLDIWNRCSCDHLDRGLDYFVLDTALVHRLDRLGVWLNSLAGNGYTVDISDGTIYYVTKLEPRVAIRGLEFYRRRSLQSDPEWARLGAIWTNRINRVKRRALKMVSGEL